METQLQRFLGRTGEVGMMKLFEFLLGSDAPLCLICKDASGRCMYCGGSGTMCKDDVKLPQPTDDKEPDEAV